METRSSDNLRRHARDILDGVERRGECFIIERWRRPVAVVVPIEEWRKLERLMHEGGEA
jgi:prevent-host-death family protein